MDLVVVQQLLLTAGMRWHENKTVAYNIRSYQTLTFYLVRLLFLTALLQSSYIWQIYVHNPFTSSNCVSLKRL